MKLRIVILTFFSVAACGGQTSSGGGTGFSTGAGKPAIETAAVTSTPTSQHDSLLEGVKPRVLAKMRSEEPVKVYSGTAPSVSRADLANLTPRAQDAIVATLPEPSFWTGYGKSHVHFRAGLLGGSVARAQVNGEDFAHMVSSKFLPSNREQIYALIAHRSGCKWNGRGTVVSRGYPATPEKLPTWFVGLSC